MTMIDVRELHTGKLLFKYDPDRDIIEIERRGNKSLIDLTAIRQRKAIDANVPVGEVQRTVTYLSGQDDRCIGGSNMAATR